MKSRQTWTPAPLSDRAIALQKSLVIDSTSGHIVAPEPSPIQGKPYLDRLMEAGFNVLGVTLAAFSDGFDDLLHRICRYMDLIDAHPDRLIHVRTSHDVIRAYDTGRLGLVFASQTGSPVGNDASRWTILHLLGLRLVQLTYNERNLLADGCLEPENRGLTAYGRQAVQEMNRLGICVDLSHVGERSALDATELSTKPVVYSHSNARSRCPSLRNISDAQMRELADTGGVMGITPHSMMNYRQLGVRPSMADYLEMIDYAVTSIGIDHVGIGSDLFESYTKLSWESGTKRKYPSPWTFETMLSDGFSKVSEFPLVIDGLVAMGYRDDDIERLLGGNWFRVFAEVWRE